MPTRLPLPDSFRTLRTIYSYRVNKKTQFISEKKILRDLGRGVEGTLVFFSKLLSSSPFPGHCLSSNQNTQRCFRSGFVFVGESEPSLLTGHSLEISRLPALPQIHTHSALRLKQARFFLPFPDKVNTGDRAFPDTLYLLDKSQQAEVSGCLIWTSGAPNFPTSL